ncbi:MAG: hypothetical protein ACOYXT_03370 [Bacteroidota bacterium]
MPRFAWTILLTFSCGLALAQGENNSLKGVPFKERIVTGGGFGLSFGSGQDFFSLSPVIGYSITAKFMAGTGITYRYTNYKYYKPSLKLNDYGVNPFLRYTVYRGFFLQTEYEYLNYEFPVTITETTRKGFSSFMAGGGLIQPLGDKAALYFMALYNFSYKSSDALTYTPYTSPLVIRAGINIGRYIGIN